MTQTDRILEMLKQAEDRGVDNYAMMRVSYQYPHHIWKLRHQRGLNIERRHIDGTHYKFFLRREPGSVLADVEPQSLQPALFGQRRRGRFL